MVESLKICQEIGEGRKKKPHLQTSLLDLHQYRHKRSPAWEHGLGQEIANHWFYHLHVLRWDGEQDHRASFFSLSFFFSPIFCLLPFKS